MDWIKQLFTKLLYSLPHTDIGWEQIQEKFTRFTLCSNRFFTVHLHRLEAPQWHPDCHDHPWSFITLLLRAGYEELVGDKVYWRRPGTVLYRPAEFSHNVRTRGVAWSLIIRQPERREWGFQTCWVGVTGTDLNGVLRAAQMALAEATLNDAPESSER